MNKEKKQDEDKHKQTRSRLQRSSEEEDTYKHTFGAFFFLIQFFAINILLLFLDVHFAAPKLVCSLLFII